MGKIGKGLLWLLCIWPTLASAEPKLEFPRAINHNTWFTEADRPQTGESGSVSFKLMIDAQGIPQSCEITKSSGSENIDRLTCRLAVSRARFTPARRDGKPEPGSYFDDVHWLNRPGMPFTVSAGTTVFEFDVDASGQIANCKVEGAKTADDKRFCRQYDRIATLSGEERVRNVHVRQTIQVEISPRPTR